MNWFKRKQQQKKEKESLTGEKLVLSHIFTGKDGVKWYQFDNALAMPAKRAIAAEVATRMQEMNLTKDKLLGMMKVMKDQANKGNIVELFHTLNEIEFRLNFIAEEETLIELASCYFVMDGEDESDFSEIYRKKKIEYIKSDPEAFNFFVQRAFEYTTIYSQLSDTDIHEYLTLNAHNAKRIAEFLHTHKS
jgi:hypothetical protein